MADPSTTPTTNDTPRPTRSRNARQRALTVAGFAVLLTAVVVAAQLAGTSSRSSRSAIKVKPLIGVPQPTKDSTRVATTTIGLKEGKGVHVQGTATLTKADRKKRAARVVCAIVGSRDGDRGWFPVELPETLGRDPRVQSASLSNRKPRATLRFSTVVTAPADDTYRLHVACGVKSDGMSVTATGRLTTRAA